MTGLARDVRFALRSLNRDRGATLLALLALGLAMGVNVAVLSLLNAILLRPLPYAEAERLVWIRWTALDGGGGTAGVSAAELEEWRPARSFDGLAGYQDRLFRLSGGASPERVSGALVSPSLFAVLGVQPELGRAFGEGAGDGGDVAVLGYELWQRRYSADSEVLGRRLEIDGRPRTIIGVMPPRFRFPEFAELWTPIPRAAAAELGNLTVVGRLRPGASPATGREELTALSVRRTAERSPDEPELAILVRPLRDYYVGNTAQAVLLFLIVSGGLLVVACANLGNFLLARALARQHEIAVRTSLGARRRRVARQLLTESLLYAFFGGVLGLAIGALGLRLLVAVIPVDLPFWADFRIDWRVVALSAALAAGAGVLFGLAPALHALRLDLSALLQHAGQGGGPGRRRLMGILVAAEVALASAVFLAAGNMGRGFLLAQHADTGFALDRALVVVVDLGGDAYHDEDERRRVHRGLIHALGGLPGANGAGATSSLPLRGGQVRRVAESGGDPEASALAAARVVTPGYTDLLGVPLLAGRRLEPADDSTAALVDRSFASRVFDSDPAAAVGRRFSFVESAGGALPIQVVGVVRDHRQSMPGEPARPAVYLPYDAQPYSLLSIVVPTDADPLALAGAARRRVAEIDPTLPIVAVRTLDDVLSESLWQPRIYTWLLATFALVGLALTALGIHGLVAYSVSRRRREIGIRVALGAQHSSILRQVMRQAALVVVVGLVLGALAGTVLSRLLAGLLVWQGSPDPFLLVALAVLFALSAFVAAWWPARRALTVDPTVVLRG